MKNSTAEEIAVTFEMLNGNISSAVKKMLLRQFSEYDDVLLLKALAKCRAECRGRITPADVISRIDDGRPGADEAWAIAERAIKNEDATVVWTEEIAGAFGIAYQICDMVACRMAFKDAYNRLCGEARGNKVPVAWEPSLGSPEGRTAPLMEAVRLGRIEASFARNIIPELPQMPGEDKQLEGSKETAEKIKQLCGKVLGEGE